MFIFSNIMISYHIISYHVISCHIISYHIISYHIISHLYIYSYCLLAYSLVCSPSVINMFTYDIVIWRFTQFNGLLFLRVERGKAPPVVSLLKLSANNVLCHNFSCSNIGYICIYIYKWYNNIIYIYTYTYPHRFLGQRFRTWSSHNASLKWPP